MSQNQPQGDGARPTETLTFNFTMVEVKYSKLDARGVALKYDTNVKPGWDTAFRPRVTRMPPEVRQIQ